MRRFLSFTLLAAACGSHPPTTKPTGTVGSGSGSSAPIASTTTKATCEVAARALVKERGFGAIPANKQDGARRGGEAEAIASCIDDQWDQTVIDCMVTRASAASCLGQLNVYQEQSYQAHFASWEMNWTHGPDGMMGGQGYGDVMNEPGGGVGAVNPNYQEPPEPEYVACEVNNPQDYAPVVKDSAPDHDYLIAMRKNAISQSCEMKWQPAQKKCFNAAKDAAAIAACRGQLDDGQKNALANSLDDVDVKMKRIADLEKNPKAVDCKAVANAHYSDDAWRGKLVSLSPAERKRLITESNAVMVKACTDDKWPAAERACLVSTTHREYDMIDCVIEEKARMTARMYRFGYPASGVTFKTGIPECDQIVEVAQKLAKCDKLDQAVRDSVMDSLGAQMAMYVDGYGGMSKKEIGAQCKQTVDMYIQGGKAQGCQM